MIVCRLRGRPFGGRSRNHFLRPTLVHRGKAPFGATPRRANRLARDNLENRVCVRSHHAGKAVICDEHGDVVSREFHWYWDMAVDKHPNVAYTFSCDLLTRDLNRAGVTFGEFESLIGGAYTFEGN